MEVSRAATGILAAICVAAGAGGTYMVVRGSQSGASEPVEVAVSSPVPAVEQPEGLVPEAPDPLPAAVPPPVEPKPARPATPARASRPRQAPKSAASVPEPAPPREVSLATVPAPTITETQPPRPIEPPAPLYDELVVAAQSVIGLQMETAVTSQRAQLEDEVVGRVTRYQKVGDRVTLPSDARVHCHVTLVHRRGRL